METRGETAAFIEHHLQGSIDISALGSLADRTFKLRPEQPAPVTRLT
jgi:hypothetical protein